jgi:hypothetical protein
MKELLFWEADESLREADNGYEPVTEEEADARDLQREARETMAREELEWFFGALGGCAPKKGTALADARPAAQAVERWLTKLSAYHQGALALRYTPREWPPALTKRYGKWSSLVVRLECALHPSGGGKSDEELERASVERLVDALRARKNDRKQLLERAETHEELAIVAYLKVRGSRASVIPEAAPPSAVEPASEPVSAPKPEVA